MISHLLFHVLVLDGVFACSDKGAAPVLCRQTLCGMTTSSASSKRRLIAWCGCCSSTPTPQLVASKSLLFRPAPPVLSSIGRPIKGLYNRAPGGQRDEHTTNSLEPKPYKGFYRSYISCRNL